MQAADKHYVDASFAQALPLTGGAADGPLDGVQIGAAYQADQFPGADFGAKLQACVNGVEPDLWRDVRCAELYRARCRWARI